MKLIQKLLVLPLLLLVWGFFAVQTPSLVLADDATATPAPSASPSDVVAPTPSSTPDVTPSPSPEVSPTPTPVVTPAPSITPDPTPTPTPTPVVTPDPSSSPTPSVSPTPSASPSPSPTSTSQNTSNNTNTVLQGSPIQNISNIVTGQIYSLSQGSIKFTSLPSGSNYINFKTVSISGGTGYEITSNMSNGSFTYDLTLPLPAGASNYVVKYSPTTDLSNAQVITQGITNNGDGTITIHGLNHFTVFVVDTNPASVACIGAGSNCYTSVQAAIDAASGGDTINIQSGTYSENVKVTKALTLNSVDSGSGIPSVNSIVIWSSGVSINNINTSVSDGRPSASITNPVNNSNKTNVTISGTGLANSNVSYSISDSGNAHTVSGTSTVSSGGVINITGVNLSSLNDGSITLTLTLNDGAGHTSSSASASSFKDTVAPATPTANITNPVNSGNSTSATINGTDEAGATINYTVSSNNGGTSVTGSTTVNNSGVWSVSGLNLSGLADGTLTLSVTSTDSAGNTSSTGTATATKDTVAPTLTSTTVTTSNSNSSYAKAGDTITLTFTSSESINTPTVTIATHSVSATNIGGNTWRATYNMVSGDTQGLIPYTIAFSDVNGNSGTTVNTNSSITFDSVAPTVNVTSVTTTNANSSYAKVGDTVTVNFTSSESIQTPTATIDGQAAIVTNLGGNSWKATRVMTSTDTEGLIAYTISYSDLAGNAGASVNSTSSITFDRTQPTLTSTTVTTTNANSSYAKAGDTITVNFTTSEAIQTPTATIAGHAATITNLGGNNWRATYTMVSADPQGLISYSINFQDLASNSNSVASTSSITFDSVAPTLTSTTITSSNSNGAYAKAGDTITLTFTGSETLQTPVVTIATHSVTATNIGGNTWRATYTMVSGDAQGSIPYTISYQDLASNSGAAVNTTSTITFDSVAPTLTSVTVTTSNSNSLYAKVGDTITVNLTSSETIQSPVVTIAGHSATVTNLGGNNWRATYVMTSSDTEGLIPYTINFADLAGNNGSAVSTNSSVTFDRTAPTLSGITVTSTNANSSYAKAGDTITLTFTGSETLQTPVVTIATHSVTATNIGGNTWRATYTMVSGDAQGSIPYTISFQDLASNSGTTVNTNSTITFDSIVPVLLSFNVTSSNANSSYAKVGDTITLTLTADEAIQTPTITIAGHSVTATNIGGNTWRATYVMTSSDTEGLIAYSIAFQDLASNSGTTINTNSGITFDRTAPTLIALGLATSNANSSYAMVGDTLTLTFTTSEAVQTPVVTIAGHSVSVVSTGGNGWMAQYTMTNTDTEGQINFTINYQDLASNAGASVNTNSAIIFDRTPPTITSATLTTSNSNSLYAKAGDTLTLTFTASEAIQTPSVTINGFSPDTLVNTSGNTWVATLQVLNGDPEGLVPYTIDPTDLAGNAGATASTTSTITVDLTAPTTPSVSITNPINNSNKAHITLFITGEAGTTVNYSITDGVNPNVVGTATVGSGGTVLITGIDVSSLNDGSLGVSVTLTDAAGNVSSTGSAVTTKDTVAPTLTSTTITTSNANSSYAKAGDVITLTFTSSETINTPTVTIAGHTVSAVNTTGNTWVATYTMISADAQGLIAYSINYSDLANNPGVTVAVNSAITFDSVAPTLSGIAISSNNANSSYAKAGDTITLTFTSSETIQTPTVTIAGHSPATLTNVGNVWTATYQMLSSDPQGLITYTISYQDLASNSGAAVNATSAITFDSVNPNITSTTVTTSNANSSYAKAGDVITLTFTTNEAIQTPQVSIAGHVVTATNTSGNIWTASYTMVAGDSQGLIPYTINFLDLAGNGNSAVANSAITFDSIAPTAVVTSVTSSNANPNYAKVGDVITVNFTTSETVLFVNVDIVGHITATATNIGGNNWTFSYVFGASDVEGPISYGISFYDLADNHGTYPTTLSSITFDRTAPTATVVVTTSNSNSGYAKVGDTVTATITASEAIQTPTVTILGHTVTATNTSGNIWVATYTLTSLDTEGLIPYTLALTDLAGNTNAIAANSTITFDMTAPTLTSTTITSSNSNGAYAKAGDTITLTFTGSETLQTPVVTIAGHTVAATNTAGNTWTASYTMVTSDPQGLITYTISFMDLASNLGAAINATSAITFDSVPPTVSAGPNTTAHQVYVQTGTASDSSGIASVSWTQVGGSARVQIDTPNQLSTNVSTSSDGTYILKLTVVDNAGNSASSTYTLNWMVPNVTQTPTNLGSCSDGKPGSISTLTAIADAMGRITLFWTKAQDPVTYYLIEYGTKSGSYAFGVPNAGGSNTSSYTIGGLEDGVRYYFRVRAGNNCMPGDFSSEASAIAHSTQGFNLNPVNILSNFATPVLGAEKSSSTNSSVGATNNQNETENASPTPTPTSTFSPAPLVFSPLPSASPKEAPITPKKVAVAVVLTLIIGSVLYYLSIIKL